MWTSLLTTAFACRRYPGLRLTTGRKRNNPIDPLRTTEIALGLNFFSLYSGRVKTMASFFFGENMKKFSKRRTDAVKGLRRYRFLFPPKNKYCLVGLKRHPDNWQLVVLTLCRIYNCFHPLKTSAAQGKPQMAEKSFI